MENSGITPPAPVRGRRRDRRQLAAETDGEQTVEEFEIRGMLAPLNGEASSSGADGGSTIADTGIMYSIITATTGGVGLVSLMAL